MKIEPKIDLQYQGLVARTVISKRLSLNIEVIRPCVANIFQTSFSKDGLYTCSKLCSILAIEFLKLGYDDQSIEQELISWNSKNTPPLKQAELRSTLRTAIRYQNKYYYGCHHDYLKEFCIDPELCSHAKNNSGKKRYDYRAYFSYRWPEILKKKPVSKLIYWQALPEIEKRRGYSPGSRLFVSHREIARYAGIEAKSVKGGLINLKDFGLIEYKAGIPRKWEGTASEVRRIFPLPQPPKEALLRLVEK